MTGSKTSVEGEKSSPSERGDDDDSDEEGEVLEESACGRWSKRRKEVQQRDVPGVDAVYLAMDMEEGMEVVWNEVIFSDNRKTKEEEEKIRQVFDELSELEHPNIVKLHKYWIDTTEEKKRVVFITEYMSSGSLKKFLKLTKRNVKKLPLQSWRRWCTQILSALSYLHSCSPPIIHGNLTTDSVFIQYNGLIKIGSVAPDAIQTHVKTFSGEVRNLHYIAPEFVDHSSPVTPAADIYSFGMCALETAALEIPGNGDSGIAVSKETIQKTISSLEHPLQKDLIAKCLDPDPKKRPNARDLLFHPLLFEVHSLKLLAAHSIIYNPKKSKSASLEVMLQKQGNGETVIAEMSHKEKEPTLIKLSDITSSAVKLREFIEDVRNGIYPLTAFRLPQSLLKPRPATPAPDKETPMEVDEPKVEGNSNVQMLINMVCSIRPNDAGNGHFVTLSIKLKNKMNRQLTGFLHTHELETCPNFLIDELVQFEFINPNDREVVMENIAKEYKRYSEGKVASEINGDFYPPNQLVIGEDTLQIQFQQHYVHLDELPSAPPLHQQNNDLPMQTQNSESQLEQHRQHQAQQEHQMHMQQEQFKQLQEQQLKQQHESQLKQQHEAQLKQQHEAHLKQQHEAHLKQQHEAQLKHQHEAQLKQQHEAQLMKQQQAQHLQEQQRQQQFQEQMQQRQSQQQSEQQSHLPTITPNTPR